MLAALSLVTAIQGPVVISTSVFEGGAPLDYFNWLSSNRYFGAGLIARQEGIAKAFGPSRILKFSDGSIRLEPPLPPQFTFEKKDGNGCFRATYLPKPYINGSGTTQLDYEDRVITNVQRATTTEAPRFEGSLSLKNQLVPLGWNTSVDPFFNDFRVYVKHSGTIVRSVFDHIAKCVGARIRVRTDLPNALHFEPNLPEIRRRALASLDYFGTRSDPPFYALRHKLMKRLVSESSDAVFLKWLSAQKVDAVINVNATPFAKDVYAYRTAVLENLSAQKSPLSQGDSRKFIETQDVYLGFDKHLCFSLQVGLPTGTKLHVSHPTRRGGQFKADRKCCNSLRRTFRAHDTLLHYLGLRP